MFAWLKQRKNRQDEAERLYSAIVSRARAPEFYTDLDVPDTLEGRYEMVVAHLVLVIERLRAEGEQQKNLARDLVERFVTDIDDSMRELGVGDTNVPKKVKSAAGGLRERTLGYRTGITEGPKALAAALQANLQPASKSADAASVQTQPRQTDLQIATYMIASADHLAAMRVDDILVTNQLFAPLPTPLSA